MMLQFQIRASLAGERLVESKLTKKPPRRVFLDTCVVNFILDYGECIHEAIQPDPSLAERVKTDIAALERVFSAAQRAFWQLAISPHTYREVVSTRDPARCHALQSWFFEIWTYWREFFHSDEGLPSFSEAEETRVSLLSSGVLDLLPDVTDRVLLIDAVVYGCNAFCTRDWSTVLKHRGELASLPLKIITPKEWWDSIHPWAGLYV